MNNGNLFDLAQLAEASYADFLDDATGQVITLDSRVVAALKAKDFSDRQATDLVADWAVITHQANTASGFSSMLFKNTDSGGGYVLAFRGTEWPDYDDLLSADVGDIVGDGLATKQIVDMYNEWQRINAASGAAYSAAQLTYLTAESAAYADATLKLSSADPVIRALAQSAIDAFKARTDIVFDGLAGYTIEFASSTTLFSDARATGLGLAADIAAKGLTVTGHSLGGHLATAFSRLFPTTGATALTVNGAGYPIGSTPGLGGMALTNIGNLFALLGGDSSFDTGRIVNAFGEDMPEIVTMNQTWGLVQPGLHQPIFIEQDTLLGNVLGHGASQMTDSLAVYDLFMQLDSNLQNGDSETVLSQLASLFEAASNDTAFSLEAIVGALGRLFTGTGLIAQDNRESLYGLIGDIKQTVLYQQSEGLLTIQPLTKFDGATIAAKAQAGSADGLAYRYALANFVPFAITGDASIYASHNLAGELDLYDPVTGTGSLTNQYLKDRAAMLSWKLKYDVGAEDADDDLLVILDRENKPYLEKWDSYSISGDWDFIDLSAYISGAPLKLEINGVDLTTTVNHQVIFGSQNGENLSGDELRDYLYGDAGTDTLTGNAGNDYLEGGAGNDTYLINAGDGVDTLLDSDGAGTLVFNGLTLTGGALVDGTANVWKNTAQGITYTLKGSGASQILLVSKDGSADGIRVQGWQSGQLGLTMAGVIAPPATSTLAGADGYSDALTGSGGSDRIFGLSGNDALDGSAGDDIIEGGVGDDLSAATAAATSSTAAPAKT